MESIFMGYLEQCLIICTVGMLCAVTGAMLEERVQQWLQRRQARSAATAGHTEQPQVTRTPD